MSYPDALLITRTSDGEHTDDDLYTPGSAMPVYDDEADVQDDPTEVRRGREGGPGAERRARAFLKDETLLTSIQVDDDAVVTFADASVRKGKVVGSRKLDGTVLLKWVA